MQERCLPQQLREINGGYDSDNMKSSGYFRGRKRNRKQLVDSTTKHDARSKSPNKGETDDDCEGRENDEIQRVLRKGFGPSDILGYWTSRRGGTRYKGKGKERMEEEPLPVRSVKRRNTQDELVSSFLSSDED